MSQFIVLSQFILRSAPGSVLKVGVSMSAASEIPSEG